MRWRQSGSQRTMENLRNLGPVSAGWLREVGIESPESLEEIGVAEAYRRISKNNPRATHNLLYALQGALMDVPWTEVPDEIKDDLIGQIGDL